MIWGINAAGNRNYTGHGSDEARTSLGVTMDRPQGPRTTMADYDTDVADTIAGGLRPLLILNPHDVTLSVAVVAKYGPNGSFWTTEPAAVRPTWFEVGNECYLESGWLGVGTPIDPGAYVAAFINIVDGGRAAQPAAKFLLSMAPDIYFGGAWKPWIQHLMDALGGWAPGLSSRIDALACHPYGPFDNGGVTDSGGGWETLNYMYATCYARGFVRNIWITEFGENVLDTSETSQNAYCDRTTKDLLGTGPTPKNGFVDAAFWFQWWDSGSSDHWGLVRTDDSQRPAGATYAAAVGGPPPPPPPPPSPGLPASGVSGFMQAHDLYHTVGVNTHSVMAGVTSGNPANRTTVVAKLQEIGIRHVRDSLCASGDWRGSGYNWPFLQALAAVGIQVDFLSNGAYGGGDNHPDHLTAVGHDTSGVGPFTPAQMMAKFVDGTLPWTLAGAICGPNEYDSAGYDYPSGNWWDPVRSFQKDLYTAVRAHPQLSNVAVVSNSFVGVPAATKMGTASASWNKDGWVDPADYPFITAGGSTGIDAYIDAGDCHPYTGGHSPQRPYLTAYNAGGNGNLSDYCSKGVAIATEAGFVGSPGSSPTEVAASKSALSALSDGYGWGFPPTPDDVNAEYLLRTILTHARVGIRRTHIYELADSFADDTNGFLHGAREQAFFGLCRTDFSNRPMATALKHFLALVGDADTTVPIGQRNSITPTITGFTPDTVPANYAPGFPAGNDELLSLSVQKTDGSYLVFLWRTSDIWDVNSFTTVTRSTQNVTVTFPGMTGCSRRIVSTGAAPTALTVTSEHATVSVGSDTICLQIALSPVVTPPEQTLPVPALDLYPSAELYPGGSGGGPGPPEPPPLISGRPRITIEPSPDRLALSVKSASGAITRWGGDEPDPGRKMDSLTYGTSIPGGFKDLSCTLHRDITKDFADLSLFDDIRLYAPGNDTVWAGRQADFPRSHGDDDTITVNAVGHSAALRDSATFREIYVDRDLAAFTLAPSAERIYAMAAATGSWRLSGGSEVAYDAATPGIIQSHTQINTNGPGDGTNLAECWYDSTGIDLGYLYAAWTPKQGVPNTDWNAIAILCDSSALDGYYNSESVAGANAFASYLLGDPAHQLRWIALQFFYDNTYNAPGNWLGIWENVAAYGRHQLAGYGPNPQGFLASDIVADIVQRTAPSLHFSTGPVGSIVTTSFVVPHFAPKEAQTGETALLAINVFHLFEWGCYGQSGREFFWRPPDPGRMTWHGRTSKGMKLDLAGPSSEEVWAGVVVNYTKPDGTQETIGPPGLPNMAATDARLATNDPLNPALIHGYNRIAKLDVSVKTTREGAAQLGSVWLAEHSLPGRKGSAVLSGSIGHPAKGERPVHEVRAGDHLAIDDFGDLDPVPRRIIETRVGSDGTNTLTLDSSINKLDAILERFGVALTGHDF